jgi:hypothetical protein
MYYEHVTIVHMFVRVTPQFGSSLMIDDSRSVIDDSRSVIDDSRSVIDDSRSVIDDTSFGYVTFIVQVSLTAIII